MADVLLALLGVHDEDARPSSPGPHRIDELDVGALIPDLCNWCFRRAYVLRGLVRAPLEEPVLFRVDLQDRHARRLRQPLGELLPDVPADGEVHDQAHQQRDASRARPAKLNPSVNRRE